MPCQYTCSCHADVPVVFQQVVLSLHVWTRLYSLQTDGFIMSHSSTCRFSTDGSCPCQTFANLHVPAFNGTLPGLCVRAALTLCIPGEGSGYSELCLVSLSHSPSPEQDHLPRVSLRLLWTKSSPLSISQLLPDLCQVNGLFMPPATLGVGPSLPSWCPSVCWSVGLVRRTICRHFEGQCFLVPNKVETSLEWQEYFSLFQDATDAFPCYIHLPLCLWIMTLTAELQRRMQAMEFRCYRKILCISYKDHVTNEEVCAKIQ